MQRGSRTHVYSWDFDGMLANIAYGDKLLEIIKHAVTQNRGLNRGDYDQLADYIIEQHKDFFDPLFINADAATKHIVYVGSDRQDVQIDIQNSFKLSPGKHGHFPLSCFPFFSALIERLKNKYQINIHLEKLLLSDAFENLPPGQKFDAISDAFLKLKLEDYQLLLAAHPGDSTVDRWGMIKQIETQLAATCQYDPKKGKNYVDRAKFLILFLQIQHALLIHAKDEEIIFRFSDDRDDILNEALTCIREHKYLLPSQATVCFQQFDPDHYHQPFHCDELIRGESTKPITDIRLLFSAVRGTHHTLNELMREHTIPATLRKALSFERMKLTQEENLILLASLEEKINAAFPNTKPKYAKLMLAAISLARETPNDITTCIANIKLMAKDQLELLAKKKGSRLATVASKFTKVNTPEAIKLLSELLVMDITEMSRLAGKAAFKK